MNFLTKLIITQIILVFVMVFVLFYYKLFSLWVFVGVVIHGLTFMSGFSYLIYNGFQEEQKQQNSSEKVKSLGYCWDKANEVLSKMVGGDTIVWQQGKGRTSDIRSFFDGRKIVNFRSMQGTTASSHLPVLIIFNMETDDVVRYISNPAADFITNPWHEFKPFDKQEPIYMGGRQPYDRRYKDNFTPQSDVQISFNRDQQGGGSINPTQAHRDRVIDRLNQNTRNK